jgi:hypothetical protein
MTRPSRSNRRDANEKELLEFWRAAGCYWIPMQPGQGFDGLLIAQNGVHIIEVKNPAKKWKLTEEEKELQDKLMSLLVVYNIVQNMQDAERVIYQ